MERTRTGGSTRARTHGATLVEVLITIAVIALGGLSAMRTLSGAIATKSTQTSVAIASLSVLGAALPTAGPSGGPTGSPETPPSPAAPASPGATPSPAPGPISSPPPSDADDKRDHGLLPFDLGNPAAPLGRVADAARKKAAYEAIKKADEVKGNALLDTSFEDELLRRWIAGDGGTYRLTPEELALVQSSPKAQQYGEWVRDSGSSLADGEIVKPGFDDGSTSVERVVLEDGRTGYRVSGTFNDANTARGDPLDGSFGKANVYYDAAGNVVGITDTYDFSNPGFDVKAVNAVGATAGAKNFAVRGGVIGRDPTEAEVVPPPGPSVQDDIVDEIRDEAGERVGPIVEKGEDVVERAIDPFLPGGDVDPIFGPFR
jgi:type II secretory pathway pseudopilin PulG